ncbi:MAG: c-type cytochrome [Rhodothermales bacterium]|nr:c-type cytochrome [Rhodothermales bacterium]
MAFPRATLVLAMLMFFVGNSALAQDGGTKSETDAGPSGLELYRQMYCGLCHKMDRAGTAGIFGPTHNGLGEIVQQRLKSPNYSGGASSAEDYIRESILEPEKYIVPGYETTVHRMPAYTHLTDREIDAIVRFLIGDE